MRNFGWAAATVVLGAAAGAARADTLRAPSEEYETIQDAIDEAEDGDTVVVLPGEHDEDVVVSGKSGLVIKGSRNAYISGAEITGESARIKLKGLSFDGVLTGGIRVTNSSDVSIFAVSIQGFAGDGIDVSDCVGLRIEKCFVKGVGGDGIRLENVDAAVVQKNRIEDVGGDAIDVLGAALDSDPDTGVAVAKNRIANASRGVAAGGIGITISANRMFGIEIFGVDVAEGTVYADVVKNVVEDSPSAQAGIRVEGNYCDLAGNKLTGCGIREDGMGNWIEKNKIVGAPTGILLEGDFPILYRNTLRGGGTGIDVRAQGATLHHNRVVALDFGIDVYSGFVASFGNRISASGSIGILLRTTGNTLERDVARGSGDVDLADFNPLGINSLVNCGLGSTSFDFFFD